MPVRFRVFLKRDRARLGQKLGYEKGHVRGPWLLGETISYSTSGPSEGAGPLEGQYVGWWKNMSLKGASGLWGWVSISNNREIESENQHRVKEGHF